MVKKIIASSLLSLLAFAPTAFAKTEYQLKVEAPRAKANCKINSGLTYEGGTETKVSTSSDGYYVFEDKDTGLTYKLPIANCIITSNQAYIDVFGKFS